MGTELSIVNQEIGIMDLGNVLAKSGYFSDARDAAQAVVKVLAGRELGFGPIASMTGFYIVKGRVSMSANLMGAAVKRSNRYDYRVIAHNETACSIEFFERVGSKLESLGKSTFTIEDARKAGTQNLEKFPRNMLFARAMSNGVKWFCPDVTGGPIYTPEELGEVVDGETGEVVAKTDRGPQWTNTKVSAGPNGEMVETFEWTVDTASSITTDKGTPLGQCTPEQLELVSTKAKSEQQRSAAKFLLGWMLDHTESKNDENGPQAQD